MCWGPGLGIRAASLFLTSGGMSGLSQAGTGRSGDRGGVVRTPRLLRWRHGETQKRRLAGAALSSTGSRQGHTGRPVCCPGRNSRMPPRGEEALPGSLSQDPGPAAPRGAPQPGGWASSPRPESWTLLSSSLYSPLFMLILVLQSLEFPFPDNSLPPRNQKRGCRVLLSFRTAPPAAGREGCSSRPRRQPGRPLPGRTLLCVEPPLCGALFPPPSETNARSRGVGGRFWCSGKAL